MQAAAIRMTSHQIALVRESFATVVPISEQAVGLFYDRLFAIDPSLTESQNSTSCICLGWQPQDVVF